MKKIISVSLAAAMLMALTACGGGNDSSGGTTAGSNSSGGSSDATYTLSIGHTTAPSEYDPYYITCIEFEKLVEEQSDGRIQVEVYSGGQLGSETEMFEGMQMGTLGYGNHHECLCLRLCHGLWCLRPALYLRRFGAGALRGGR